jgi:hypothetical protein
MRGLRSAAVAVGLLSLALPGRADRVGVSLSSGIFVPRMTEVRDMYGTPVPVAFAATWMMRSGVGFSLGFEYLNAGGETVGDEDERLPIRLRLWTVPASIDYGRDWGWVRASAGLGAALNFYRETWETEGLEGLSAEGQRLGVFVRVAAEVPITSRLAAAAVLRYGTLSTNFKSYLGNSINLGGASLLVGLSYSFATDVAVRVHPARRRTDER